MLFLAAMGRAMNNAWFTHSAVCYTWCAALLAAGLLSVATSWPEATSLLILWMPALLSGLWVNIQISLVAMVLGTLLGLVLGGFSISPVRSFRSMVNVYVQFFRNAPALVLIYFCAYVFPFELYFAGHTFPFPDWVKVVIGLGLPASAQVAEIFRGAVQSIPATQWEAAQSLALSRIQTLRFIILPQCLRRMLPPWMNVYTAITMSTSLVSLVGVNDVVLTAGIASNSAGRTDFTILSYTALVVLFFLYCYPISRLTRMLEKRYEYK